MWLKRRFHECFPGKTLLLVRNSCDQSCHQEWNNFPFTFCHSIIWSQNLMNKIKSFPGETETETSILQNIVTSNFQWMRTGTYGWKMAEKLWIKDESLCSYRTYIIAYGNGFLFEHFSELLYSELFYRKMLTLYSGFDQILSNYEQIE